MVTSARERAAVLLPRVESVVGVTTRRSVDAVTAVDSSRHGPPAAIHRGSVDGQRAGSHEVGASSTIDRARRFITEGCHSQICLAVRAPGKLRRAAAIGGAGLLAYPVDTGSCAYAPACAAIVQIGILVDLTTVARVAVAVGETRVASDAAGSGRAGRRAVGTRACRTAYATIGGVRRERLFTTVCRTAIAIAKQVRAGTHSARAASTGGRCVGVGTHIRASSTVVDVRARILFATIGGVAVTTGKTGTTCRHTGARCAGGGSIRIRAGVVASATVGGRIERHFTTIGGSAVAIPETRVARAELTGGAAAHPRRICVGTGGRAAAAVSGIRSQ